MNTRLPRAGWASLALVGLSLWQLQDYVRRSNLSLQRVVYGIDFNHYYASALLVIRGASPYCVNTVDVLRTPDVQLPPLLAQPTNPPLFAVLTAPLALASPAAGWAAWQVLLVASLFAAVWLVGRTLGWTRTEHLTAAGIFLLSAPVAHNLRFAQVQPVLLLLTVAGWLALRRSQGVRCGIAWGVAIVVKFYLWPLALLLLLLSELRAALVCLGTAAVALALPLLLLPSTVYSDFARCGKPIIEQSALFFPMNYSIGGMLQHTLYAFGMPMLKDTGAPYPVLFYWIPLTGAVSLLGFVVPRLRRLPREVTIDLGCGVATVAGILSSPVAWPHYFVFLLLLAAFVYRPRRWKELGAVLVAIAILPYSIAPIESLTFIERLWFAWRPLPSLALIAFATYRAALFSRVSEQIP